MPTELDELRRRTMQLEIEEAALKKEDDRLSQERLVKLQEELAENREEFARQKAQWDNEKSCWSGYIVFVRRSKALTRRFKKRRAAMTWKRQRNFSMVACHS